MVAEIRNGLAFLSLGLWAGCRYLWETIILAILFFATNYILAELSGCQLDQFGG